MYTCTCVCYILYYVLCTCLRVTSVNRINLAGVGGGDTSTGVGGAYSAEQCVIQLIPHLNLNAPRLQQILQGIYLNIEYIERENKDNVRSIIMGGVTKLIY